MRVTNGTPHLIAANVGGTFYELAPNEGVDVDARTALTLGEYGLTLEDKAAAIVEQDVVVPHRGERRLTDGRQHVSDDPRANVPGTPVGVTGDTGSTDPSRVLTDPGAVAEAAGDPAAAEQLATPGAPEDDPNLVPAGELKGDALDEAVKAANDAGATIDPKAKADDKRAALVEWHSRPKE